MSNMSSSSQNQQEAEEEKDDYVLVIQDLDQEEENDEDGYDVNAVVVINTDHDPEEPGSEAVSPQFREPYASPTYGLTAPLLIDPLSSPSSAHLLISIPSPTDDVIKSPVQHMQEEIDDNELKIEYNGVPISSTPPPFHAHMRMKSLNTVINDRYNVAEFQSPIHSLVPTPSPGPSPFPPEMPSLNEDSVGSEHREHIRVLDLCPDSPQPDNGNMEHIPIRRKSFNIEPEMDDAKLEDFKDDDDLELESVSIVSANLENSKFSQHELEPGMEIEGDDDGEADEEMKQPPDMTPSLEAKEGDSPRDDGKKLAPSKSRSSHHLSASPRASPDPQSANSSMSTSKPSQTQTSMLEGQKGSKRVLRKPTSINTKMAQSSADKTALLQKRQGAGISTLLRKRPLKILLEPGILPPKIVFPAQFDDPTVGVFSNKKSLANEPSLDGQLLMNVINNPSAEVAISPQRQSFLTELQLSLEPSQSFQSPQRFTLPPIVFSRGDSNFTLTGRIDVMTASKSNNRVQYKAIVITSDPKGIDRPLCEAINNFPHLQHLVLENCTVHRDHLILPALQSLVLFNNSISTVKTVNRMLVSSPGLRSLVIQQNPLNTKMKAYGIPPIESPLWKHVLLRYPHLEFYNNSFIDNATRSRALEEHRSSALAPIVADSLFHSAVNYNNSISSMQHWTPLALTTLSLSSLSLMTLHLTVFQQCTNLTNLDLSYNKIKTLIGTGIHLLVSLSNLNLSNNSFATNEDLLPLAHLPVLDDLNLLSNAELKKYRPFIIFMTRFNKGTGISPGLRILDNEIITLKERLIVLEEFMKSKPLKSMSPLSKVQESQEHARLLLIEQYGHNAFLQSPHMIRDVRLVSVNLTGEIDLKFLPCLQRLYLSRNSLTKVLGLASMPSLTDLDISENPQLNLKDVCHSLSQLKCLKFVSLCPKRTNALDSFRQSILQELFCYHPNLMALENKSLNVSEYVNCIHRKKKMFLLDGHEMTEKDISQYAVMLSALLFSIPPKPEIPDEKVMEIKVGDETKDTEPLKPSPSSTPPPSSDSSVFRLHPQDVLRGNQIQFDKVQFITLCCLQLSDPIQIPNNFGSLTALNISQNRLSTVSNLQLSQFPVLEVLNLADNRIKDPPETLGAIFTTLKKLQYVKLTGNPCAVTKNFRFKLLCTIPGLISPNCRLVYIDSPITIEERIFVISQLMDDQKHASPSTSPNSSAKGTTLQALSALSAITKAFHSTAAQLDGNVDEAKRKVLEKIRFELSLHYLLPTTQSFRGVLELCLENCQLAFIDMSLFPALQKLLLRKNELQSLENCGIEKCNHLLSIDVRNNRLKDLDSVLTITSKLRYLQLVGLRDNKFDKNYRAKFILGMLLACGHSTALTFVDDIPVSSEEKVLAFSMQKNKNSIEKELFRFHEIINTKIVQAPNSDLTNNFNFESIRELDLSSSKLRAADFSRFPNLERLNICSNFFTDDSLQQSGVHGCVALTEFYLDDNSIKSVDAIANVCIPLAVLKKLSFGNNPAMKNEEKPRQQYLSHYQAHVIDLDFPLVELNRRPISIDEKVNAFVIAYKKASKGQHRNQGSIALMPTSQPATPLQPESALSPSSNGGIGGRKFGTLQSPLSPQSPGTAESPAGSRRASILSPPNKAVMEGLALPSSPYANTGSSLASPLMFAAESARFGLVIDSKIRTPEAIQSCETLKLSGLRLMYLQSSDGIGKFTALQRLDLRGNDFDTLENQGLEHLPSLTYLDLRDNNLPSLERVVNTLHYCNSLEEIFLHKCTRTDETADIQRYLTPIFSQLKGIRLCDKYKSPLTVRNHKIRLSALTFLQLITNIGPNQLHELKISNSRVPKEFLYYVISAAYELEIPNLHLEDGNEWAFLPHYHDLVIVLMGKHLIQLDGQIIGEQRRFLALQTNSKRKFDEDRLLWSEVHEEAHLELQEWLANENREIKAAPSDKAQSRAIFTGALPGVMTTSAASSAATSTGSSIMGKIEILIHYLQILGVIIMSNIDIPWPNTFFNFTYFTQFLTFAFDAIPGLDVHIEKNEHLIFGVLMSVPALFLLLFLWLSHLRAHPAYYEMRLIKRWNATISMMVLGIMLVGILLILIGAFAFDDGQSFRNVTSLKGGITNLGFTVLGVMLGIWAVMCVFMFAFFHFYRKYYIDDESVDKFTFRAKWLTLLNWSQIAIMFFLTILFLPISRVILSQFACDCDTNASCSVQPANDSSACFPHHVTGGQIAAIIFAVGYIIGLPVFYVVIISRTVKLVLSTSRQYSWIEERIEETKVRIAAQAHEQNEVMSALQPEERQEYQTRMKEIRKKEKTQLQEYRRELAVLYRNLVNLPQNIVPSSSLFIAFDYRFRFYKIFQMMQKLLLLVIALFIPTSWGSLSYAGVVLSAILIGGSFLSSALLQPYSEVWETRMDAMAGLGNTINVLVAIGLLYNWSFLTPNVANIILFVANGIIIASFVVAFVIVPTLAWRASKAKKRQEELERQRKDMERKLRAQRRRQSSASSMANIQEKAQQGNSSKSNLLKGSSNSKSLSPNKDKKVETARRHSQIQIELASDTSRSANRSGNSAAAMHKRTASMPSIHEEPKYKSSKNPSER